MIDLITFNKINPCINQIETHLFCQRKSESGWLKKYGLAHQAYAPLGQGRANEMFENEVVKKMRIATTKRLRRLPCVFLSKAVYR